MNELFIFDELFMGGDVIYIAEADIQAPNLFYAYLDRSAGMFAGRGWTPSSDMNFSELYERSRGVPDFILKDYPLDITG